MEKIDSSSSNLLMNKDSSSMDYPQHFRCPISMELMKDPVTISTGVSYERKNIEKWFHTYNKKTCPATMQSIDYLQITPNHTLKRLIVAWLESQNDASNQQPSSSEPVFSSKHDELAGILSKIETSPFKVSSLRKLRSSIESGGDDIKQDFKRLNGIDALVKIMVQILVESNDFVVFRACEEALGVLYHVPLSEDDEHIIQVLMSPDCTKSMSVILQRGSAEARFWAISTFQKISKVEYQWNYVAQDQDIDFFKSLLEIVSDEISTRASSCSLQLLLQILDASKKSRLKFIETGAMCTLVEILPDSNRPKSEKILLLIKLLCECAEGRLAFIEHDLAIAVVTNKILNVSNAATKIGVKIMWLVSNFHPTDRVLEEILFCGGVKKLVALLNVHGESSRSVKDKVIKILKLHGRSWKKYPCFTSDVKEYLGLGN